MWRKKLTRVIERRLASIEELDREEEEERRYTTEAIPAPSNLPATSDIPAFD